MGGWGGVPGKGEDGPLEGPGNTQPGSATRPRESQTRAQNILFVTRPPPHPVVWLVAAPAVEVRGAPGGLPRVGLPAPLALRPGPATRAAPQRRLRHAVRPRLPGCPGHGRWTRAGGRAFLTGRPNPRPAARPPPDSGVGWTRCVERGYSGRALRPPGRHDGARRGVRGGGLGLSWSPPCGSLCPPPRRVALGGVGSPDPLRACLF